MEEKVTLRWYGPKGHPRPPCCTPVLGDLLVISVSRTALRQAAGPVVEVRKTHPWAPLVLVVPGIEAVHLTAAATLVQRTAARLIDDGSASFPEWRHQLLDIDRLPNDFASMLHFQRPKLRRKTTNVISRLVSGGATGEAYQETIESCNERLRAVESRFERSRLQPPSKYHRFGRLTAPITALARSPLLRVRDVIRLSGYADRATFTRAVKHHLGTSPSRARLRISWEWIAHRMRLDERCG